MQSIESDTNHLNEIFEPGFSNNVDKKFCLVFYYNSLALNSEFDLIIMHLNIFTFGALFDYLHAMFDNRTTYPHVLVLSETEFSEQSVSDLQGFKGYHTLKTTVKSGGNSVYIKSCLDCRFLPDLSFPYQDIVCAQ